MATHKSPLQRWSATSFCAAVAIASIGSSSAFAQAHNMFFGAKLAAGDFDCDGIEDIVAGVPEASDNGKIRAGIVEVHYGLGDSQALGQSVLGKVPADHDQFGWSLAAGDFDLNGCDDLAIGAPGRSAGGTTFNAGAVYVVRGFGQSGLDVATVQTWSQNAIGADVSEADDRFGWSLAVGNFGFDGAEDLAIGAAYEKVGNQANAGAIHVLFGVTNTGLTTANTQFFNQNSYQIVDTAQFNDYFGYTLVAGNFGYTGRADLAIAAPGESYDSVTSGGAVHVLYGHSGGLATSTSQFFTQSSTGADPSESQDMFGYSLGKGDFDGSGYDELAIGVPHEDIGSLADAGIVHVFYGGATGIASVNQVYGIGTPAASDNFGWAVIGADLNGNGLDDLVAGVIGRTVAGQAAAGQFVLFNGDAGGNLGMSTQSWSQGSTNVESDPSAGESFGNAFCAGDFDGDDTIDIAVGVPGEAHNGFVNAGAINVIESRTPTGLTGDQGWMLTQ